MTEALLAIYVASVVFSLIWGVYQVIDEYLFIKKLFGGIPPNKSRQLTQVGCTVLLIAALPVVNTAMTVLVIKSWIKL